MGLFSSEYTTHVATTVSRAIPDRLLPDSIKAGSLKGIFAEGVVSDYVMEEMTTSIALRAERMYAYADREYVFGSPSGEVYSSTQGREAVAEVLRTLIGPAAVLDYCHFGAPNKLHIGWMRLMELHGYNPQTNILGNLTAQLGTPVYLANITVVVPASWMPTYSAGALEQWGVPASSGYTGVNDLTGATVKQLKAHTPVFASPTALSPYILVDYSYSSGSSQVYNNGEWEWVTSPLTGSFTQGVTGFDEKAEYFNAKYSFNGATHYWLYQVGSGTYPTLDEVFDDPAPVNGQFYPFAYFRYGNQAMPTSGTSANYLSSKKLVKFLGLDYDTLAAGINSNPQIGNVEQAMLMMAVPANTGNQTELRYLFDFFDTMYFALPEQSSSATVVRTNSFLNAMRGISSNAMVIQDRLFKMALSNNGIHKTIRVGQIGAIGTYSGGTTLEQVSTPYTTTDRNGTHSGVSTTLVHHRFYRKQITDNVYEEVQIVALKTVYYVYGNYVTIGDTTDPILMIPLDRSITKHYPITVREELYGRSLHYVFNSMQVTETKWYQSDFFQAVLTLGAIFVFITTGIDTEVLMMGIAFGAGAMTLAAFAWALTTMYLLPYLATAVAVKYFVKVVGADFTLVVALVAMAYGMYKTFDFQSTMQTTWVKALEGAPWAKDLLTASTNLVSGVQDSISSSLASLKDEASEFSTYVDNELKTLEKLEDTLNKGNTLTTMFIPSEIPSEFFARTIHQGNIGILGLSAITSYVDVALTLPKLTNSTEGFSHG